MKLVSVIQFTLLQCKYLIIKRTQKVISDELLMLICEYLVGQGILQHRTVYIRTSFPSFLNEFIHDLDIKNVVQGVLLEIPEAVSPCVIRQLKYGLELLKVLISLKYFNKLLFYFILHDRTAII